MEYLEKSEKLIIKTIANYCVYKNFHDMQITEFKKIKNQELVDGLNERLEDFFETFTELQKEIIHYFNKSYIEISKRCLKSLKKNGPQGACT